MSQPARSSKSERAEALGALRRYLTDHWPVHRRRQAILDEKEVGRLWDALCADMALGAVGAHDGFGGAEDAVSVIMELGRALCPVPFVGSVLLNRVLAHSRDAGLASGLSDSTRRVAVVDLTAFGQDALTFNEQSVSGRAKWVDVPNATHILILAESGVALAKVSDGSVSEPYAALGETLFRDVSFVRAEYQLLSKDATGVKGLIQLHDLLLAARAVGSAERGLDLAVEHAKSRVQFGRSIGTFQALQHKLADGHILVQGARLLVDQSATAFDEGRDWSAAAFAAVAFAARQMRHVMNQAHHTLAAVGYAEEHEAPAHFRSVHFDAVRCGGARAERRLADHLLVGRGLTGPDLGTDAEYFRQQVKDWLQSFWIGDRAAASAALPQSDRNFDREVAKALGAQGWTALSWPKSEGGQDRSARERLAFVEETALVDLPTGAHASASNLLGPALLAHGSDIQRQTLLPLILAGELSVCLGYSEPEAGSDLAAVRTRAERCDKGWRINGQKLWTTSGDKADMVLLVARTNPSALKHEGISLFIVDMRTPGISVRPTRALHGGTFCTVFYDDVVVPDTALLGSADGGWTILTAALADERILMGATVVRVMRLFDRLLALLKQAKDGNGKSLASDPPNRAALGRLASEIKVARALLLQSILLAEEGRTPTAEAAMSKVYSSELMQRLAETAVEMLGFGALISGRQDEALLAGEIEQTLRQSIMMVVGGGTNEIQRSIIARHALDLPRR